MENKEKFYFWVVFISMTGFIIFGVLSRLILDDGIFNVFYYNLGLVFCLIAFLEFGILMFYLLYKRQKEVNELG